jgi:metal-dependent hydrolase (beta-lactamase superfamily II)
MLRESNKGGLLPKLNAETVQKIKQIIGNSGPKKVSPMHLGELGKKQDFQDEFMAKYSEFS